MSYEAISLIGIGASLVCAYLSSLFDNEKWMGRVNKLLFISFSLLFIVSSFGTGVQISRELNGTIGTGTVADSVGFGYGVSTYLLYTFMTFIVINFLHYIIMSIGGRNEDG